MYDNKLFAKGGWGKQLAFLYFNVNRLFMGEKIYWSWHHHDKSFGSPSGQVSQHSSSASLMGWIKLLVDLYWLTWLTVRVFIGLICMVLRWVFSGSSVNHVFSEKEPKSYRDKEEGYQTINATRLSNVTFSVIKLGRVFFRLHCRFEEDIVWTDGVKRNSDMMKERSIFSWQVSIKWVVRHTSEKTSTGQTNEQKGQTNALPAALIMPKFNLTKQWFSLTDLYQVMRTNWETN